MLKHAREKGFCKPVSTPLGRPKSYYTPHIKPNIIRLRGEKGIIVFFPAVKALFCRSFSFVRASPLFFYERWSKQDPKPPFIPFGKTPPPTEVRDTLSSAKSLVRRMTIFFVHLVERGKKGGSGKKRGYGIRLMTWTLGQWGKRQRGRRNLVFSHLRAGYTITLVQE